MNTRTYLCIGIVIAILGTMGWFYLPKRNGTAVTPIPTPTQTQTPASKDDLIVLDTPLPQGVIKSPVTIEGRARGGWYFEGSFPVKLYDANGTLLASAPVQAQSDWMTSEYVPFTVTLTFTKPATATGVLVLEKDNPSGLPQHANELRVPVVF